MDSAARWTGAIQRIALTAWVGAMWGVGFLVVPTLFAVLDDGALAGEVAGKLFYLVSYLGMTCAGVLLAVSFFRKADGWKLPSLVLTMLVLNLVAEFYIVPQMTAIQQQAGTLVPGTDLHAQFEIWHHVVSGLFVLNSVMGLLAILTVEPDLLRRRR